MKFSRMLIGLVCLSALPAFAEEDGREAPLLVQAHQAFVRVQGRDAQGTITWTVAVLDPRRADGNLAPPELEGVASQGAVIRQGRLDLPDGMASGTVLSFQGSWTPVRGPFAPSGTFSTVPGLVTARAELVVRASGESLSLWTDPTAIPSYNPGSSQEVRVVWRDVEANSPAEAHWSAGAGWLEAGRELSGLVDSLTVADPGRDLTEGLTELTPGRALERVDQRVKLVAGSDLGWIGRPARYVLDGGSGTRAERGLVLLSLLRKAGFDAQPALYRPNVLPGSVPASLAAPGLLGRPLVAVRQGERLVLLDPGAPSVDALPPDLAGAVVWVAGDVPRAIAASGAAEGQAPISGEVRLDNEGGASFSVNVTATGTADAWLREKLSAASEAGRSALFASMCPPGSERVTVRVSGLEDRTKPLRIQVAGRLPTAQRRVAENLVGAVAAPVLAPGLAAWLPARIAVHEEIAFTPPPGWALLTIARGERPTDAAAVVARDIQRQPDKVVAITDVERPFRHLAPADQQRATAVLSAAATAGPELLFFQDGVSTAVRTVRSVDRPAADRVALEAIVWWRMARYAKARKLLDRFLDPIGLAAADDALLRYEAPYELRRALVDLARSEADRLATVPLLVGMERAEEALLRAAEVSRTREPTLRIESRLWMLQLQAPSVDKVTQEDLRGIWRDPDELLAEADASARLATGQPDPRVLLAKARRLLAAGRTEEAQVALEAASGLSADPMTAVLLAQTLARRGAPLDRVRERLEEAVRRAPADPALLIAVGDTLANAGLRVEALERSVAAARLAGSDEALWGQVVDRSLAAGDLATALFAARRASDLALRDVEAATRLTRVATLAGDDQQANLGWSRGGTPISVNWPPKVHELLPHVPESWLLAVLRHHDVEVTADPGLLSLRAQLELAGGDRNRAARDGLLLSEVHGIARGAVVAFGASIGEVWQSDEADRLDALVRADPAAREARLELRAITGGAVEADLRAMKDEPRAKPWLEARRGAEALGALDPAWKAGLPPKSNVPRGYIANPWLGAARGVAAWSNPDARRAILRHAGSSLLPPPLSVLYTVRAPPLRSAPGGGLVVALDGGSLPLYAAWRAAGGERVIGLGYSPEDAVRALEDAPP